MVLLTIVVLHISIPCKITVMESGLHILREEGLVGRGFGLRTQIVQSQEQGIVRGDYDPAWQLSHAEFRNTRKLIRQFSRRLARSVNTLGYSLPSSVGQDAKPTPQLLKSHKRAHIRKLAKRAKRTSLLLI